MKAGNQYREDLAKRTQQNLVEMGCVAPPDALKMPLKPEKPAPIDTMDIPDAEPSEEMILKYGRRMATLMAASSKPKA